MIPIKVDIFIFKTDCIYIQRIKLVIITIGRQLLLLAVAVTSTRLKSMLIVEDDINKCR